MITPSLLKTTKWTVIVRHTPTTNWIMTHKPFNTSCSFNFWTPSCKHPWKHKWQWGMKYWQCLKKAWRRRVNYTGLQVNWRDFRDLCIPCRFYNDVQNHHSSVYYNTCVCYRYLNYGKIICTPYPFLHIKGHPVHTSTHLFANILENYIRAVIIRRAQAASKQWGTDTNGYWWGWILPMIGR